MSKTHLTEQKFSDFALHPAVIEALEKKGFHNCTPIQALALPLTLEGRDVAGQAQTGTGKTMAFPMRIGELSPIKTISSRKEGWKSRTKALKPSTSWRA